MFMLIGVLTLLALICGAAMALVRIADSGLLRASGFVVAAACSIAAGTLIENRDHVLGDSNVESGTEQGINQ